MEQRLIDANSLLDKSESLYMRGNVLFHGVTAYVIENAPTIDPETLPIVQELREQLERVTRERDALLKEFAGDCGMCLHYEDCAKKRTSCGGADWEWYGLQKEVQDDG